MATSSGFLDGVTNALNGLALRQAQALDLFGTSPLTTAAGVRYTTGTDLQVTFTSGLNFSVAAGSGLTSSITANNAGYPIVNSAAVAVALTAANATNPRIDLIYGYVLDDGSGTVTFESLAGTPAPVPVAPTVARPNYLLLAQITVPAGIGSNLATATISDQRLWLRQALNPNGIRAVGAGASGPLSLGTSYADVPGCSVTVTTRRANVPALVLAVFDISMAAGFSGSCDNLGNLNVDGSTQTATAQLVSATAAGSAPRQMIPQNWTVNLGSAGSHTLKLQGRKTTSDGIAHNINSVTTTINVLILE